MSSHSFIEAWTDWGQHMSQSPGRQLELIERTQRNAVMLLTHFAEMGGDAVAPFAPKLFDHRFRHPGWQKAPFSLWQQCFLAAQDWWDFATDHLRGLRPEDADRTRFMVRQALDTMSPSNFPALNPEIIEATVRSGGRNLVEGAANFARDAIKTVTRINDAAPKGYRIGEGLACTPGQVVFRGEKQRRGDGAHGPQSAGEGVSPIEPSPGTCVLQT
jgi:polyhydroxyalkanoate synthase